MFIDIITTAGQVCASVTQMRALGLAVSHVVVVIDRQQGGRENIESLGCTLSALFTLAELERLAQAG